MNTAGSLYRLYIAMIMVCNVQSQNNGSLTCLGVGWLLAGMIGETLPYFLFLIPQKANLHIHGNARILRAANGNMQNT